MVAFQAFFAYIIIFCGITHVHSLPIQISSDVSARGPPAKPRDLSRRLPWDTARHPYPRAFSLPSLSPSWVKSKPKLPDFLALAKKSIEQIAAFLQSLNSGTLGDYLKSLQIETNKLFSQSGKTNFWSKSKPLPPSQLYTLSIRGEEIQNIGAAILNERPWQFALGFQELADTPDAEIRALMQSLDPTSLQEYLKGLKTQYDKLVNPPKKFGFWKPQTPTYSQEQLEMWRKRFAQIMAIGKNLPAERSPPPTPTTPP